MDKDSPAQRETATRPRDPNASRRRFLGSVAVGVGALAAAPHLGRLAQAAPISGPPLIGHRGETPPGGFNILLVVTDQESFQYPTVPGFELPARRRIAEQGVSFLRHYTASSMCTASRSVLYTGRHVQNTGLFDNSNYPYTPDFPRDLPTLGHMLQSLGHEVVYKGKWHLSKAPLKHGSKNFRTELEQYGFQDWEPDGDHVGLPLEGYFYDDGFVASGIAWLRRFGTQLNAQSKPWFLAVNLVNPHDIQWAHVDPPGERIQATSQVAKWLGRPPNTALYQKVWETPPPRALTQPLDAQGRPPAHAEFGAAWDQFLGHIPASRADMWQAHNDFYLNLLRDNDRSIGTLLAALDELRLTERTIVVFTADHGEYLGAHGGLRNKGPGAYEENIHVPMTIAHPAGARGATSGALTSSVDLVPTLFALAGGKPEQLAKVAGRVLPGRDFSGQVGAPSQELRAVRPDGLLYNYEGLLTLDRSFVGKATANALGGRNDPNLRPDFSKRGLQRTYFDGRYKFSRYFAPERFNTPDSLEALLRDNDIELFDRDTDPDEMLNLAAEVTANRELILSLNGRLNALVKAEVGSDEGGAVRHAITHWGSWARDKT